MENSRQYLENRNSLTLGQIRRKVGLTQSEVGSRMNMAQQNVSRLERKDLHKIKIQVLVKYIEAVGGKLTINIVNGEFRYTYK